MNFYQCTFQILILIAFLGCNNTEGGHKYAKSLIMQSIAGKECILHTHLKGYTDRNFVDKCSQQVMIHYLKNKVGVVGFANAQGVVMF